MYWLSAIFVVKHMDMWKATDSVIKIRKGVAKGEAQKQWR